MAPRARNTQLWPVIIEHSRFVSLGTGSLTIFSLFS